MSQPEKISPPAGTACPDRRDFMIKACSVVIGGALGAAPLAAGLAVFADPLRGGAAGQGGALDVRVTTLAALPADGVPRKFPVLAEKSDAWTKYASAPIGAVFLRRTGDKIEALNVICPHNGCFVDYQPDKNDFLCPCHGSTFKLDGAILGQDSPAPRGLDTLVATVKNDQEVYVEFQNFVTGTPRKIPRT